MENLVTDVLIGAAVGDAFGVPYEFLSREEVSRCTIGPMVGKGDEGVPDSRWGDMIPAGAWSDDTSMSIAAMEAISDCGGEVSYDAIMCAFLKWWEDSEYASLDFPFGLGGTVSDALHRFKRGKPALECGGHGVRDNGNGSLMRMFPFALICIARGYDLDKTASFISDSSAITHGHEISKMACLIYAEFLRACVNCNDPNQAFARICEIDYSRWFKKKARVALSRVTSPHFKLIAREQIAASGYVVDTLEGALYSVLFGYEQKVAGGNGFEATILEAVRIGYDTDTTACVAGSIAGALYGLDAVPQQWCQALRRKDYLQQVARRFAKAISTE